jgi:hypothetical protein
LFSGNCITKFFVIHSLRHTRTPPLHQWFMVTWNSWGIPGPRKWDIRGPVPVLQVAYTRSNPGSGHLHGGGGVGEYI